MSTNPVISVIMPCYNSAKFIATGINSALEQTFADFELIIINDGSTDNTLEIINHFSDPRILVINQQNTGVCRARNNALGIAKGEFIGYTHADMQTDPADVLKALEIIEQQKEPQNCYVKGDRKGRPLFDQFFTAGMSLFETLYMGMKLWDINAQPNIFHKSFFESLQEISPKDFSLDLFFLYKATLNKMNIIRFDVIFPPRIHGESSWNTGLASKWKFIKRTIEFSVKLKKEL